MTGDRLQTIDRDLLNAAPAGFVCFRDSGDVAFINDPLLRALGYARDDVVGKHVERLFGIAGRIFFQTHLFPLVRMRGLAEEIYVELRSKEGRSVPVLLNAQRHATDDPPLTYCVVMRVHERKKYEDELLRAKKAAEAAHGEALAANEAKSHYLRSVSHEIRTPINALLGYADLLELGAGKPMGDDQMVYVARVRHAARHLLTLVNHILDLAKIESGAMTVDLKPADIATAADAALAMVAPQALEKGLRLVAPGTGTGGTGGVGGTGNGGNGGSGGPAGPGVPGAYVGDPERVLQILINLLSNAVKFTESDGRVELDWERVAEPGSGARLDGRGPWLRVRVADTGIGIPPDRLEDVFQPFQQVLEASAAGQGTGLGLTISRELARLMHGDITVRSKPGEGSVFSLWLPAPPDA